eukprot:5039503-Amphidinium_carterae.1
MPSATYAASQDTTQHNAGTTTTNRLRLTIHSHTSTTAAIAKAVKTKESGVKANTPMTLNNDLKSSTFHKTTIN